MHRLNAKERKKEKKKLRSSPSHEKNPLSRFSLSLSLSLRSAFLDTVCQEFQGSSPRRVFQSSTWPLRRWRMIVENFLYFSYSTRRDTFRAFNFSYHRELSPVGKIIFQRNRRRENFQRFFDGSLSAVCNRNPGNFVVVSRIRVERYFHFPPAPGIRAFDRRKKRGEMENARGE